MYHRDILKLALPGKIQFTLFLWSIFLCCIMLMCCFIENSMIYNWIINNFKCPNLEPKGKLTSLVIAWWVLLVIWVNSLTSKVYTMNSKVHWEEPIYPIWMEPIVLKSSVSSGVTGILPKIDESCSTVSYCIQGVKCWISNMLQLYCKILPSPMICTIAPQSKYKTMFSITKNNIGLVVQVDWLKGSSWWALKQVKIYILFVTKQCFTSICDMCNFFTL